MARRALVVGSQTGSLAGVHNDVAAISDKLRELGFALDVRTESNASYAGIVDGYERLIGSHGPEDVALVYYSGHGGFAPGLDGTGRQQFLVPTDYERNDGTFGGLFSFELSVYQARLTAAGRNVTVILDCCHAATMSRDPELQPRALPRLAVEGVAERLAQLAPVLAQVPPEGNPYAVRLVATEAELSAFEGVDESGKAGGFMTNALIRALAEAGSALDSVSWAAVGARVRELVIRRVPQQRPEVEGPARRRIFSLVEIGGPGGVAFFLDSGQPSLRAGRLLGAGIGAIYGVMPYGVTEDQREREVAKATVTALDGGICRVGLEPPNATIPDGALAFPRALPFETRPVRLDGVAASSIYGSRWLRPAALDTDRPIATLTSHGGELVVLDPLGSALTPRLPDNEAGRNRARSVLEQLSRADAIRTLPPGGLPGTLSISWGRVMNGERVPIAVGETLHVGESVYVEVTNTGSTAIYVAAFDIGVDGEVTLLTHLMPHGVWLTPGLGYTVGGGFTTDKTATLQGLKTYWPENVPADGPRAESFVVLATEEQTQFEALQSRSDRDKSEAETTPLGALLHQVGTGGTRNVLPPKAATGRYLVRALEFEFSPLSRSTPGRRASFAVDESIAPAFLQRAHIEAVAAPVQDIAIRFKQLVVHRNHAFWSTDIRVDTLVVSEAPKSVAPYQPTTRSFSRIGRGDALPFDDLLVFVGQPHRYIDLSIWVSKDKSQAKPLSELLKDTLNDTEFQAAAAALAGLVVAAPAAATLVAAAAAAGTVGYFAARVLSAAVGTSIGVYRTSFLPPEFGHGRHPMAGMIRAQDFSFNYEIVRAGATP